MYDHPLLRHVPLARSLQKGMCMSRMIDRMYAHGFSVREEGRGERRLVVAHVPRYTGAALEDADVFVVDNVAEYLYAETDQEEWHVNDDFPCLALPAPVCWFETRRPSRLLSSVPGRSGASDALPVSWGMVATMRPAAGVLAQADTASILRFIAVQLGHFHGDLVRLQQTYPTGYDPEGRDVLSSPAVSDNDRTVLRTVAALSALEQRLRRGEPPQTCLGAAFGPGLAAMNQGRETAFVLNCALFIEQVKGHICGPVFLAVVHLDAQGKALAVPYPDGAQSHVHLLTLQRYALDEQRAMAEGLRSLLFPFWLAISFLHCANVRVETHASGTTGHPALRKRYHGKPRVVYKTLDIAPMQALLRTEGRSGDVGLQRALHSVRGHFADYRTGAGLFGRHHGLFWRETHLRGASSEGIVVKDYNVQSGKDTPHEEATPRLKPGAF